MKIIRRRDKAEQDKAGQDKAVEKGNYPAALRVTAPLLPSIAVLVTILAYLVAGEIAKIAGPEKVAKITGLTEAVWEFFYGDFVVLGGFLTGLLVWFLVAWFLNPYTRCVLRGWMS